MTTINGTSKTGKRKTAVAAQAQQLAHANWMGGISYDLKNPLAQLRMAAASCFFGEPMYYHDDGTARSDAWRHEQSRDRQQLYLESDRQQVHLEQTLGIVMPSEWHGKPPAALLESAIDAALEFDAKGTLEIAVALRHEDQIRTTPQVIMVRAANHPAVRGTSLIREYAPRILTRTDEPAVQLAYQVLNFGHPIPNSLKKAWKAFLEHQGEHQLAKYRMESRVRKTVDVVNVCHAHSEPIDKLMKGTLSLSESTWESLISAKGSSKATWAEALDRFLLNPKGHMALLRNLRKLDEFGLVDARVLAALKAGVKDGRQLPFRYWSAYNATKNAGVRGEVLDTIEECLMLALAEAPHFDGKVISLCDNSGSAQEAMTSELGSVAVNHIANLTGILTGMSADDGYVGVFGDELEIEAVRKKASVFDQLERMNRMANTIGSGTENGIWLFWEQAIREKQHWDHVFIYSDMQAGHGGLYGCDASEYSNYRWNGHSKYIDVAKLVADYRKAVNPDVMVYMVQVAGYRDTLLPEVYDKTVILGGWGAAILRYAKALGDLMRGKPCAAGQAKPMVAEH